MTRIIVSCLAVGLVFALAMVMAADDANPNDQTQGSIKAELMKLEAAWARMIVKDDAKAIGQFMTDDWCIINTNGSIMDRSRFLSLVASGELTHDLMEFDDWRVKVYGGTAVVTAKGVSKGKFNGRAFSTFERSTSVYARIDGRWKCVLTQLTSIPRK